MITIIINLSTMKYTNYEKEDVMANDNTNQDWKKDAKKTIEYKKTTSSLLNKRLNEVHQKEKTEGYLNENDVMKVINAAREEALLSQKTGEVIPRDMAYIDLVTMILSAVKDIVQEPMAPTFHLPKIQGSFRVKDESKLRAQISTRLRDHQVFRACLNYRVNPNFLSCVLRSVADIVGKEHIDNILNQLGSFANIPIDRKSVV